MAKVLNLDELAKEERVITLGGTTYPMKEMSVQDFVDITKRAETMEKKKEDSVSKRVEFLAETAGISFPTCPKEVLMKRTLSELNAIVAFARDGSVPEGAVEEGEEEKKDQEVTKESQS